jgi:hypothetical protein
MNDTERRDKVLQEVDRIVLDPLENANNPTLEYPWKFNGVVVRLLVKIATDLDAIREELERSRRRDPSA